MKYYSGSHAHVHVHYWANGVAKLINSKESNWNLAKESNDVTQWMNHAALFAWSPFFVGMPQELAVDMFQNNINQGLPFHFAGRFVEKVKQQSKISKIQTEAILKIKELHQDWPDSAVHSLIAATGGSKLMHGRLIERDA